jgi:hypothetical protein
MSNERFCVIVTLLFAIFVVVLGISCAENDPKIKRRHAAWDAIDPETCKAYCKIDGVDFWMIGRGTDSGRPVCMCGGYVK